MKHVDVLYSKEGKPLRRRAEIMIWRNGKVLVTSNTRYGRHWYGLPGGGIDEGEDGAEAAAREALEEVGIAVKNVQFTGEINIGENPPGMKGPRARMYGGSYTMLYKADYLSHDRSLYGSEGDAAHYFWMTVKEAHEAFLRPTNGSDTNDKMHRVREIEKYL